MVKKSINQIISMIKQVINSNKIKEIIENGFSPDSVVEIKKILQKTIRRLKQKLYEITGIKPAYEKNPPLGEIKNIEQFLDTIASLFREKIILLLTPRQLIMHLMPLFKTPYSTEYLAKEAARKVEDKKNSTRNRNISGKKGSFNTLKPYQQSD